MADHPGAAYTPTTEPNPKKDSCFRKELTPVHLILKVLQLVLSSVAFICEEVISLCNSCVGLYIFEFVSCSAVLLTILMLVIYCTPLGGKINIPSFKKIDFVITIAVGVVFLLAAIIFVATIESSTLVQTSVAFGFLASFAFLVEIYFMFKDGYYIKQKKAPANAVNGRPEVEPLTTPVQAVGTETA
ncbi:CKLF-like MARVEL transmembrane domain-containing protein 6 [Mixophyes fleayi]|uniref:CKLF-like MARVEL transmembrane domain-containing protein 6 n=1 Tax=Mixophyes fleayi TaxID=3061075 RepID=UPI003F4DD60C